MRKEKLTCRTELPLDSMNILSWSGRNSRMTSRTGFGRCQPDFPANSLARESAASFAVSESLAIQQQNDSQGKTLRIRRSPPPAGGCFWHGVGSAITGSDPAGRKNFRPVPLRVFSSSDVHLTFKKTSTFDILYSHFSWRGLTNDTWSVPIV